MQGSARALTTAVVSSRSYPVARRLGVPEFSWNIAAIFRTGFAGMDCCAAGPSVGTGSNSAGESAAIALCLNEKADTILMDEALGRKVAEQLGLHVIGILGVLVQSRRQGLLLKVGEILDQLEKGANFWISPHLRAKVLNSVGE